MKRMIAVLLVALLGAPLLAQDAKDEAAYRKAEAQLEATVFPVFSYEDADVAEVIKDIARRANITIVLDKKALEGLPESDRKVTLELNQIKASSALSLVLGEVKLVKGYRSGFLFITTSERAEEAAITRVYDVRDITVKIVDFAGPKIRLKAQDDSTAGPIVEFPPEDQDVEVDDVVELIEESVNADWGGKASVKVVKGNLIVMASRAVHKEVAKLLRQLRASK